MATMDMATPAETSALLARAVRVLALFCASLVYVLNLFFYFLLMPRIADMLASLGLSETASRTAGLPIEVGHFIRGHTAIEVPVFVALAIWNGWAIYQPKFKLRRKACLVLASTVLFSLVLFILAFVSGVKAAMAGENSPAQTVIETVTLPTGEVIMNESKSDDDYCSNRLFYQASAAAPQEWLGEITQENSVISLHEPKPVILREGDRLALIIGAYVFEREEKQGKYRWGTVSTNPNAVALNFVRTAVGLGDSRFMDRGPFASYGYVYDHLDLGQNILVTRYKDAKNTKLRSRAKRAEGSPAAGSAVRKSPPEFLIYSASQFGQPLTFDLARTRAINGLPQSEEDLSAKIPAP